MSSGGSRAAQLIKGKIHELALRMAIFQAPAVSVSSGMVTIQEDSDDGPQQQAVPMLRGANIAAGDLVVVAPIGDAGSWVALGSIDPADDRPAIGQVFTRQSSASAADTSTNTSTSTYVNARSVTWSDLPDGTYDVTIYFSVQESHSGSGSVHNRLTVNGVNDSDLSLSLTTARESIGYTRSFADVAVTGGLSVVLAYKLNGGSGTITARNPAILATLTYKGDS